MANDNTPQHITRAAKCANNAAVRSEEQEPLAEYALVSLAFVTATAVGYRLLRRRHSVPELKLTDLLLLGLATNRLSRLITRDKVARPVRAPFTEIDPNTPAGVPC